MFRNKKHKAVTIEHIYSQKQQTLYTGICWKVFFFSLFPFIFRKDWKALMIFLPLSLFLMIWLDHLIHPLLLFQIPYICYAPFYNRFYLDKKLKADWIPSDEESRNHLYECGLVSTPCPKANY